MHEVVKGYCGQVTTYLDTLPRHPQLLALDKHHPFSTGEATSAPSNSLQIIANSRFAAHFDFDRGDRTHKDPVTPTVQGLPLDKQATPAATGACCQAQAVTGCDSAAARGTFSQRAGVILEAGLP